MSLGPREEQCHRNVTCEILYITGVRLWSRLAWEYMLLLSSRHLLNGIWRELGGLSPQAVGTSNAAREMQPRMKLVPAVRLRFDGGWWCSHQSRGIRFMTLKRDIWCAVSLEWFWGRPIQGSEILWPWRHWRPGEKPVVAQPWRVSCSLPESLHCWGVPVYQREDTVLKQWQPKPYQREDRNELVSS